MGLGSRGQKSTGSRIRIRNTAGKFDSRRLAQILIRKLLRLLNFDDGVTEYNFFGWLTDWCENFLVENEYEFKTEHMRIPDLLEFSAAYP